MIIYHNYNSIFIIDFISLFFNTYRNSHFIQIFFKLNFNCIPSVVWLVEMSYQNRFDDIEPIAVKVDHQYSQNNIVFSHFSINQCINKIMIF